MLFHPVKKLPTANTAEVSQHCDIPPTVMHYLGKPTQQWPFSRSVFSTSEKGRALLFADNQFLLLTNPFAATLSEDEKVAIYNYHTDPKLHQPLPENKAAQEFGTQLKALVQFYYNGLISNSWYRAGS